MVNALVYYNDTRKRCSTRVGSDLTRKHFASSSFEPIEGSSDDVHKIRIRKKENRNSVKFLIIIKFQKHIFF